MEDNNTDLEDAILDVLGPHALKHYKSNYQLVISAPQLIVLFELWSKNKATRIYPVSAVVDPVTKQPVEKVYPQNVFPRDAARLWLATNSSAQLMAHAMGAPAGTDVIALWKEMNETFDAAVRNSLKAAAS